MSRLTKIIFTMVLLAITQFQGTAQRPVTPPSGLPQERWELTFDDYRSPISNPETSMDIPFPDYPPIPAFESLINLKKEVVLVRDGEDIYIQGLFSEYANSWIKGTVNGDRLVIPNNQILDASGPVYFHWGSSDYTDARYYMRDQFLQTAVFTPEDAWISLEISNDGKKITCRSLKKHTEYDRDCFLHAPSFWFDNDEKGDWVFAFCKRLVFDYNEWSYTDEYYYDGSGYPDIPYMINMSFRKLEN